VQEALTNVLRHAHASRAKVSLGYGQSGLDVVVEDDGDGITEPTNRGHGLVGVRERVALYGGSVHLGAASTGGARLSASLPLRELP
jgi:signal transduction histidine kinase